MTSSADTPRDAARARRFATIAVAVVGAAYAIALVFCSLARLSHPFEIEWMEGGMLTHAARAREGLPIYAKASSEFVPFFYTPLYPIVVAWLSKLTGALTFGLGRSVTFGATLATLALVYRAVSRETGERVHGLVAIGVLAATYRFAGTFHDLVRPDALALAIVFAAAYVARYATTRAAVVLSAALFVAAFFAKQTTAVMAPAAAITIFARDKKLGVLFAVVGAVLGAGAVFLYDRTTDHQFWFYIFKGHQGHLFYWKNILLEYWRDVLFLAPALLLVVALAVAYGKWTRWIAAALLVLFVVALVQGATTIDYATHMYYREALYHRQRALVLVPPIVVASLLLAYRYDERPVRRVEPFWLVMFVAGAFSSALNHSTQWAYSNCFMPIALFGSVAVALAFAALVADATPRGAALVAGALLVQLAAFAYDPREQVPGARDRVEIALFERRLASVGGPTFVPAHPFLAYANDKRFHLHQMGTGDVGFEGGVRDLGARLARGEWRAVVLDAPCEIAELDRYYYESDRFTYDDALALMPRTGFAVRPTSLWRPQTNEEHELAPGITGTFETGKFDGWTASGAFDAAPATRARIGDVKGMQGAFAASSRGSGDAGKLASATFVLTKPRVTLVLGGSSSTYVRVMRGSDEIQRLYPPRLPKMQAKSLDMRAHVGAEIAIEIVDEGGRADGGIVVDDVRVAD